MGEGGLGEGLWTDGGREGNAWGKGGAWGVGLQVDADTVGVLGMLEEEPGAGEGLLTRGADVARWLVPSYNTAKVDITFVIKMCLTQYINI